MSFTLPRSQKSAADVIEHLADSGTGRDKISVLKKWLSVNRGANGEELLNFLHGRIHVGHSLKDEDTGTVTDVSIGVCTIEKADKFLRGDSDVRSWPGKLGPSRTVLGETGAFGSMADSKGPSGKASGPKNLTNPNIPKRRRPVCQCCHKRFRTESLMAKFCSPVCRVKSWRRYRRWHDGFLKRLDQQQAQFRMGFLSRLLDGKS